MRFHLVAPPYLPVRKDVVQSAFVPLAYNMAVMLHRAGHTVTAYVAEGSDLPCTEQVTLLGEEDLCRWHGERDWRTSTWSDWNDTASEHWKKWLESVNQELSARYRYRDLVLLSLGSPYQLWSIPANAVVLYACGYDTPCEGHIVWPSYAWMHTQYGRNRVEREPRWFDAVIPHYLDVNDFPFVEFPAGDYLLYLGRIGAGKGEHLAATLAEAADCQILVAGLPVNGVDPAQILGNSPRVTYVGPADHAKRCELMGHARALFMPTLWTEPFGMVAIEAMACGTPVICTDWGALTETVVHGVTGYRCRSLSEFVSATRAVRHLSRYACRLRAERNYDLRVIWPLYERYFQRLMTLYEDGWYQL